MSILFQPEVSAAIPSRISRRRWLAGAGWITIVVAGCETRHETIAEYQVAGPSMAPTLWGPSVQFSCTACQVRIRVDVDRWQSIQLQSANARQATRSAPRCWHCGTLIDVNSTSSLIRIKPDVVTVVATPVRQIQARLDKGEKPLVVVKREGSIHIKRLLAGPGQIVTADDDGRVLVDGNAVAVPDSPQLPIDLDDRRVGELASRWRCVSNAWQRDQRGVWSSFEGGAGSGSSVAWLVYEHRNIYRSNVVSRVLDDCPANLGLDRRLNSVDEIGLTFVIRPRTGKDADALDTQVDHLVRAMVWTDRGLRVVSKSVPGQSDAGGVTIEFTPQAFREGEIVTETDEIGGELPTLSPTSPVAIGMDPRAVLDARSLKLWRLVSWRAPALSRWELRSNEWFVAGDNVPVSVDSRTWGPVQTNQIIGVCQRSDRNRVAPIHD